MDNNAKEMTVGDLIERLKAFSLDLPVYRSYDSGACVGSVNIVVECLIGRYKTDRCVILASHKDDLDSPDAWTFLPATSVT